MRHQHGPDLGIGLPLGFRIRLVDLDPLHEHAAVFAHEVQRAPAALAQPVPIDPWYHLALNSGTSAIVGGLCNPAERRTVWAPRKKLDRPFHSSAILAQSVPAKVPGNRWSFALKLYSRHASPFASRCRIQMYAKNLPIELVEVPAPNPEEYRALNPIGKVPALDLGDGNIIPESQVICEFLEARFPEPPLLPKDPETRARAAVLSRLADLYVLPLFDPLADQLDPSTRNEAALSDLVNELFNRLDQLETLLRGAPFAVGKELSLADCALAPAFFFITRFAPTLGQDPFEGRPKLDAWWREIQRHPAVSRVLDEMTKGLATLLETGVPPRINPDHGESSGAEAQGEPDGFLSKYVCQKLVSRMLEAARSGTFGGVKR